MQIKKDYNYGLDWLRVFSMFCIIILHLLGHGGVISTVKSGVGFTIVWFWEILALPAVNCFVLLSGFVGYRQERYYPKLRNILSIWFTVMFYSVILFVLCSIFHEQDFSKRELLKSLLPVLTKRYWFVSAYFAMFFFSPIINFFVHKANKKMLMISVVVILLLAFPSLNVDPFDFNTGYSVLWFISLYLFGAIIKEEQLLTKISVSKSVLCIAVGFFVTWGVKILLHFLGTPFSHLENIFNSYSSPTILLMAIGWLALFSKLKTNTLINKVVAFLTPSVFSVYLIHDNPYVRQLLMSNRFVFLNDCNPVVVSVFILVCAMGIFLTCICVDKIRVFIFKILFIHKLIECFERMAKDAIETLYKRILLK